MVVYTDSVDYARMVTGEPAERWSTPASFPDDRVRRLAESAFDGGDVHECKLPSAPLWNYLLLVEQSSRSHYDLLIELCRGQGALPDGVLLLAGSGTGFHGQRGRAWSAPPGNVYLSVHLTPDRVVEHPGAFFTVLSAVSVVDAIDAMPGFEGRAGIKWVNDVLISGAKVGGVLGWTQSVAGRITGAILGIGVNVETDPATEPTPFVPRATSLRGLGPDAADCTQAALFARLAEALDRNYRHLMGGGYADLLDRYRDRSLVIGREVAICSEESGPDPEVLATGRVTALGRALELSIDGFDEPFSRGRLVL